MYPCWHTVYTVGRTYTMSHGAHRELMEILRPFLQRKEYNSRSTEPIAVENMVTAGLRTLQGGRVKDARHIVKSSRSAAYAMVDDFIDAVNSAPEMDIKFPQHVDEWRAVNEGFRRRSDNDTMGGAVTAIDGFFQRCNRPTIKETNNVVSYYSGHYESYRFAIHVLWSYFTRINQRYNVLLIDGVTENNYRYFTSWAVRLG